MCAGRIGTYFSNDFYHNQLKLRLNVSELKLDKNVTSCNQPNEPIKPFLVERTNHQHREQSPKYKLMLKTANFRKTRQEES